MEKEMKNVEFVERSGCILTFKIDGVERDFFIDKEIVEYISYSSSLVQAGDLGFRDSIVTEILSIHYGTYGPEYRLGDRFNYFHGWQGLDYVRGFKKVPVDFKL